MAEVIKCSNVDCDYYEDGECILAEVEVSLEGTCEQKTN